MSKERQLKRILESGLKEMLREINNIWYHNNINNETVIMDRHIKILFKEISPLINKEVI